MAGTAPSYHEAQTLDRRGYLRGLVDMGRLEHRIRCFYHILLCPPHALLIF